MSGTALSLFSGIGGLDCGLARAGWRHVGFCESEPYRRAVLSERFPGVPIDEDVRSVGVRLDRGRRGGGGPDLLPAGERERGEHRGPDLLCGGFPCQDLSVAGRRRGLAGDRSGLFFEFARIADALRPRRLLIENVPGLLTSNGGRDFGELLGTLADLGYGVGWRILDSRYFGVPQRRRRVFIVGALPGGRAGAERAGQVLAVGEGCHRHPPAGRGEVSEAPDGVGGGVVGPLFTTGDSQRTPLNRQAAAAGHIVSHALTAQRGQRFDPHEQDLLPVGASVRRLTPRECERLQGLPDDWTLIQWKGKPAADSLRYAALGDAVTANVGEWLGRRLLNHLAAKEAA